MSHAQYATVRNYVTVGITPDGGIVQAVEVSPENNCALTGLLVDVAPRSQSYNGRWRDTWKDLDALESGYNRVRVTTTDKHEAWMYVAK